MKQPARALAGAIGCVLLILSPAAGLHAQERLGRLFSSPEQRLELDRLRDDPDFGKAPEPAVAPVEPLPEPGQGAPVLAVRVDGVVLRGGAHRVSWINGVMTGAGTTAPGDVRFDANDASGGRVRIRLPDGRPTVALKPGQKIDGAEGRVLDAYERRSAKNASPVSGDRVVNSGAGDPPIGGESGTGAAFQSDPSEGRAPGSGLAWGSAGNQ